MPSLRQSQLPKPNTILFGITAGWSPAQECPPPPGCRCKVCGALRDEDDRMVGGRVTDGSRMYCAACRRTGFEHLILSSRADWSDLADVTNNAIAEPSYDYDYELHALEVYYV